MTPCPACNGTGHTPEPEALAGVIALLRSFVTRIDTELGEMRDDLVILDQKITHVGQTAGSLP